MADKQDKSLMRSLGEFFGHVAKGVRTDPSKRTLSSDVEEEVRDTPRGKVTIRRTTTEEMIVEPLEGRDQVG